MIVRVITKETLVKLRRQARRKRKEDHERFLNTTGRDVIEMLNRDLSWNIADIAHSGTQHESEPKGSVVPELPCDEAIGPFADEKVEEF